MAKVSTLSFCLCTLLTKVRLLFQTHFNKSLQARLKTLLKKVKFPDCDFEENLLQGGGGFGPCRFSCRHEIQTKTNQQHSDAVLLIHCLDTSSGTIFFLSNAMKVTSNHNNLNFVDCVQSLTAPSLVEKNPSHNLPLRKPPPPPQEAMRKSEDIGSRHQGDCTTGACKETFSFSGFQPTTNVNWMDENQAFQTMSERTAFGRRSTCHTAWMQVLP